MVTESMATQDPIVLNNKGTQRLYDYFSKCLDVECLGVEGLVNERHFPVKRLRGVSLSLSGRGVIRRRKVVQDTDSGLECNQDKTSEVWPWMLCGGVTRGRADRQLLPRRREE